MLIIERDNSVAEMLWAVDPHVHRNNLVFIPLKWKSGIIRNDTPPMYRMFTARWMLLPSLRLLNVNVASANIETSNERIKLRLSALSGQKHSLCTRTVKLHFTEVAAAAAVAASLDFTCIHIRSWMRSPGGFRNYRIFTFRGRAMTSRARNPLVTILGFMYKRTRYPAIISTCTAAD